jgi:hypothetical protein
MLGSLAGIVATTLLGLLIWFVSWSLSNNHFIDPQLVIILVLFAGIGSVTSLLQRISSIDLREEINRSFVFISGGSKPFVATAFAIIVYFILENKIVGITVGNPSGSDHTGVYIVTSFLCGFSERFATDIISHVSATPSQQVDMKSDQ